MTDTDDQGKNAERIDHGRYKLAPVPSPIDAGFMYADGLTIRLDAYYAAVKILYEPYKLATTRKALKQLCASLTSDNDAHAIGDVLGPTAHLLADKLQDALAPLGLGVKLAVRVSEGGVEAVTVQRGTFAQSVEIARLLLG